MEEKYFEELRAKYNDLEKCCIEIIEKQKIKYPKLVKTKGKKYGVVPYEEERLGNRKKGKEVDEIEMEDGYFIYHFDEEGRIRIIEEACTSLRKLHDFECYEYLGNEIYSYRGNSSGLINMRLCLLENNQIRERYSVFRRSGFSYEKYIYQSKTLIQIDIYFQGISDKEPRRAKEVFYYDENKNLQLIQRLENNRLNRFCSVKVNGRKTEAGLEKMITEAADEFFHENGRSAELLQVSLDSAEKPFIRVSYGSENPIQNTMLLREFPLDIFEEEKVINSILKTLLHLWDEQLLEEGICAEVKRNGINILEAEGGLPGWLKKNPQVYVRDKKICYKFIEKQNIPKSRTIREIFRELKKEAGKASGLRELTEIFEKLGQTPVKKAGDGDGDDLFLMQAESVINGGKLAFGFSLVRQVLLEGMDEFYQMGLEAVYELTPDNKMIADTYWSDQVKGDFFAFVRSTDTYNLLCEEKICDVHVFLEET